MIGRTIAESTPTYTELPKPPRGSPNVLIVVLDDLGFGQLGCYGGDIATPHIDALAGRGLRYNRFHVTSLCSPTRAALLTGRNHHAVGMGFLTDIPVAFPGYNGRIPPSAATLPRILRDSGYSTMATGKWHLTPRWEQSAAGPFSGWPLGLGFERHYGFLAGDANQWTPELVCDNHFVDPPSRPEDGYHLTEDLVDRALRNVTDVTHAAPGKPWMLYFATGAMHAPHHAPREWIERYRGAFDDGWEQWRARTFDRQVATGVVPAGTKLPERPSWVSAWTDHSADERRLFARQMECFAGFLSHTDAQIGRLLEGLDRAGQLDNTLVVLISDNGTSAEGGPVGSINEHRFTHDLLDDVADSLARIDDFGGFKAYNHYAWGWAWAGNTPLKLWKRYTWLGGVRTPMIMAWPGRIPDSGEIRNQFCHVIDLMPTVLDAIGLEAPATVDGVDQQRIDGASLVPTWHDASADSPRDTQYFEMLGSRAIYHDGWKATTDHVGRQLTVEMELLEGSQDFAEDRWSLYHLDEDFSESDDLAERLPQRLAELVTRWDEEAEANQVFPIEDTFIGRAVALEPNPWPTGAVTVYRPGGGPIAEDLLAPMGGGFVMHAEVDLESAASSGVVAALGDWNNGWVLLMSDGRPSFVLNLFGDPIVFSGDTVAGPGAHVITVDYDRSGGARRFTLGLDGEIVATGELDQDLPFRWQIGGGGMRIGHDAGFPVIDTYAAPHELEGTVVALTFVNPFLAVPGDDPHAQITAALRHE